MLPRYSLLHPSAAAALADGSAPPGYERSTVRIYVQKTREESADEMGIM